ncbi:MAG: 3-deoxy-manno-octulosonate cytidylyltransferase [Ignavibacteriales bacterium]|nr:MAG: 3-deoxy-manno-octulosonate cytidylyltransferase [Ignavibacteriales bacterium]
MIVGIIPARLGSTRLPGKPLADIGGKPMIYHTYNSASGSKLIDRLIVATDDEVIYNTVTEFGGEAIMTSSDIKTGSDRIAATVHQLRNIDIVVNIQGDEPFIPWKMIDKAIEPLLFDKTVEVSTLVKRITDPAEYISPDTVKAVFDYYNFALYFSRSPLPYVRDTGDPSEIVKYHAVYKHIGLYVYRYQALMKFTSWPQTDLENLEKLEQLRMLEKGMKIKVVETDEESIAVDTLEDLNRVRKLYGFEG